MIGLHIGISGGWTYFYKGSVGAEATGSCNLWNINPKPLAFLNNVLGHKCAWVLTFPHNALNPDLIIRDSLKNSCSYSSHILHIDF